MLFYIYKLVVLLCKFLHRAIVFSYLLYIFRASIFLLGFYFSRFLLLFILRIHYFCFIYIFFQTRLESSFSFKILSILHFTLRSFSNISLLIISIRYMFFILHQYNIPPNDLTVCPNSKFLNHRFMYAMRIF